MPIFQLDTVIQKQTKKEEKKGEKLKKENCSPVACKWIIMPRFQLDTVIEQNTMVTLRKSFIVACKGKKATQGYKLGTKGRRPELCCHQNTTVNKYASFPIRHMMVQLEHDSNTAQIFHYMFGACLL